LPFRNTQVLPKDMNCITIIHEQGFTVKNNCNYSNSIMRVGTCSDRSRMYQNQLFEDFLAKRLIFVEFGRKKFKQK